MRGVWPYLRGVGVEAQREANGGAQLRHVRAAFGRHGDPAAALSFGHLQHQHTLPSDSDRSVSSYA